MSVLARWMLACLIAGYVGLPAFASALICETLGSGVTQFDYVTTQALIGKPRAAPGGYYGYGCDPWGFVGGTTCSPLARATAINVIDVTATRQSGTAVRFTDGGINPCTGNVDHVYTGGGAVRLPNSAEFATVDTTGTHPSVAACGQAINGLATASAAFAAMPPGQTFGDVTIKRGQELVIDATGGGVIRMDELTLEQVPIRHNGNYGYPDATCGYARYPEYGGIAVLRIEGNPADEVVINVGDLQIGSCAEIESSVGRVLFNVAGYGRKVRIGQNALVSYNDGVHILAPTRIVSVRGARTEADTRIGSIFAKKLITLGYVYQFIGLYCP